MAELCFNTFNRSAWHEIEPDLPSQISAAAAAGFRLFGPDVFLLDAHVAAAGTIEELATLLDGHGMRCWEIAALALAHEPPTIADARHMAELASVLHPEWILTNVNVPVDAGVCATFERVCDILSLVGARPAA